MCMLHTAMGKTLPLKHNVCTPCPYDRGNLYLGTMGIFRGINFPEKPEDVYEMGSPCQFGWIGKTNAKVIEFPDYTRGGWKAAKPFTVDEIDIRKFDFGSGVVRSKDAQTT